MCAKFLQYRDGGKTDEKGISTHLYGLFTGEVINGMAVSQNSPLGMSVLVSEGRVMIDSGSDYPYLGFTDANEVVTITTADGSNPRIDAIVAYVDLSVVDSTNANNPGAFKIVAVAGTPAGSPSAPNSGAISTAIGSGNPFIRLANVTVGTGVTTITTGNVSNQRVMTNIADNLVDTDSIINGAVTPVKWTNPYKFYAYRSAAHDSSGTAAKVPYESELYDSNSNFSTANNDYTAPVAGFYDFHATAGNTAATSTPMQIILYKNGSAILYGQIIQPGAAGNNLTLSGSLQLAANDVIDVRFVGGGGSVMYTGATICYFQGHLFTIT